MGSEAGRYDFSNRDEYCTYLAAQPNGQGESLTELIDGLLIENTPSADGQGKIAVTGTEYSSSRQFTFWDASIAAPPGLFSETTITLSYNADRTIRQHRYDVAVSWIVKSLVERKVIGLFVVGYAVTAYDNGLVYGFVSEPDLLVYREKTPKNGRMPYEVRERRMTGFDYDDLARQLSIIHDLDNAPWRDNGQQLVGDYE